MGRIRPAVLIGLLGLSGLASMQALHGQGLSAQGGSAGLPASTAKACLITQSRLQGFMATTAGQIVSMRHRDAGQEEGAGFEPLNVAVPSHCDVMLRMDERRGLDGQTYAITFRLRLPDQWNGRLLFQGGGGTNGFVGDALGVTHSGGVSALAQGYAVVAQDSGHDNARNTDPAHGGTSAFARDPEARANYGGRSLPRVANTTKAILRLYYGKPERFSYFVGCSKGGQEGMMAAQRYPGLFNGIVAMAPGFSLPRAALAEAWNTQSFANILRAQGTAITLLSFANAFSMSDLALVHSAVLDACDALDGQRDGMVSAFRQCTSALVAPRLKALACSGAKNASCLGPGQITALERVHDGARSSSGQQIYPGFPWDSGWSAPDWRLWMLGRADGSIPALNYAMGAPSLATIFMTPPRAIGPTPEDGLTFQLALDFDRDPPAILQIAPPYTRSAWQDIGARSPDLDAFRRRGGKIIVPHGVSDPVFSINDTLAWWDEVNQRYRGAAAQFARVFPVPGMNHCAGGVATDNFDAFGALVDWTERGHAPAGLPATASPLSQWTGGGRLLCPYPQVARRRAGTAGSVPGDYACERPVSVRDRIG